MENASKALIIAGAILLSILIIALGIYVFNMAKGSLKGDQLNEMEKNTFNSQFTEYEGKHPGSEVKSLVDKVISSYNDNSDEKDKFIKVRVQYGSADDTKLQATPPSTSGGDGTTYLTNLNKIRRNLSEKHIYTVEVDVDGTTGYVNLIKIKYASTNSLEADITLEDDET